MRDQPNDMDRRSAWRILDFARDIFMHHRKFTPFQKFIFVSFLMGALFVTLCRNWWGLTLLINYGLAVYSAIQLLQILGGRNVFLPSDRILKWIEIIEGFVEGIVSVNFVQQSVRKTSNTATKLDSSGFGEVTSVNAKQVNEDVLEDQHVSLPSQGVINTRDHLDIEREIQHVTKLIHKDFFISWYDLFTKDELVWSEAEVILIMIFDSLQGRLVKANIPDILRSIMILFRTHVHNLKEAEFMFKAQSKRRKSLARPSNAGLTKVDVRSRKTLQECYETKTEIHPALKSAEFELAYQRAIVDCLLLHLLPKELLEIKTLMTAIKEILSVNLLHNVIASVGDPMFLYEKVILITSDEEPLICKETESPVCVVETDQGKKTDSVQSILVKKDSKTNLKVPEEKSDLELSSNNTESTEKKPDIHVVKWKNDIRTFPVSKTFCSECNRLCSRDRNKIPSHPHTCSLGSEDDLEKCGNLTVKDSHSNQGTKLDNSESYKSRSSPSFVLSFPDCDTEEVFKEEGQFLTYPDCNIPSYTREHSMESSDMMTHKDRKPCRDLTLVTFDSENDKQRQSHQNSLTPNDEKGIKNFNLPNIPSLFPKFSLNIPNPLSSLQKPLSLGPLKLSPSDLTTNQDEQNKDVKKSQSSGVIFRRQKTPVTPRDQPDMNGCTENSHPAQIFQDVRITSTESAKEPGSNSLYTLYEIEFEAIYQTDTNTEVHKTGTVKRRFREFVNLQTILEANSDYKRCMKDVKGPKRILPSLPFGNMGRDTLESRKALLVNFLQSLIKKEVICNSEEMKQFLGYSGDGHIAFVRKASETSIPRIDQRLVKTMSGVFDKIVEGLPSLPQQIPRMIPSFESPDDKKDEPEQLEDKDQIDIDLALNSEETLYESVVDKFMYERLSNKLEEEGNFNTSGNTSVHLGISMLSWQTHQLNTSGSSPSASPKPSHFSKFIGTSHGTGTTSPSVTTDKAPSEVCGDVASTDKDHLNEDVCPLSDAILDILTELLRGQDSWMCRDTVMKSTRLVFGKGLNRYLQSKIKILTSEKMNSFYLKKFRETFWPDDVFLTNQKGPYTDFQREAIMKQARRCLGEFLPGVLRGLLGVDDFEHILNEAMHSVKYEQLNRHVWYSILDILIEEIFPEINSQELQRKLSSSMEKS